MSAADKLAQVLAEHGDWGYGHGEFIRCDCGTHVGFPDDDGQHKGKRAHAAHVAAILLAHLTAEGWAQGREEWGVRYKRDVVPMPDEETARKELRELDYAQILTLVRRRVTDWEPVDA